MAELNDIPTPPPFDPLVWRRDPVLQTKPNMLSNLDFRQLQQVLRFGLRGSLLFVGLTFLTKDREASSAEGNRPFSCLIKAKPTSQDPDPKVYGLRLWSDLVVLTTFTDDGEVKEAFFLTTFAGVVSHLELCLHGGL